MRTATPSAVDRGAFTSSHLRNGRRSRALFDLLVDDDSSDFFDGDHVVIKGASPATARELLRPTFRNWFRARSPYVYAAFRLAMDV